MPEFIQLTAHPGGQPIYVDPNRVAAVTAGPEGTDVLLTGVWVTVRESPHAVGVRLGAFPRPTLDDGAPRVPRLRSELE